MNKCKYYSFTQIEFINGRTEIALVKEKLVVSVTTKKIVVKIVFS